MNNERHYSDDVDVDEIDNYDVALDADDFDDYRDEDRWDWDYDDPSQYCRHGAFIGSWWGPDILCLRCELGD